MALNFEPYVETSIVDQTIVSQNLPLGNQLRIIAPINAETGDFEITRFSQGQLKEFLFKYTTDEKLTPDKDTTIRHIAKILQFNSIYVVRAGDTKLLVGIDDKNNIIYFDKNLNLLDRVSLITISKNPLIYDNLWIAIKDNTNTQYQLYTGTTPSGYPNQIDLQLPIDINTIFDKLNRKLYDNNLPIFYEIHRERGSISILTDESIIKIINIDPDIKRFDTITIPNKYRKLTINIPNPDTDQTQNFKYIEIDSYDLYLAGSDFEQRVFPKIPVKIKLDYQDTTQSIPQSTLGYYSYAIDEIYKNNNIPTPIANTIKEEIIITFNSNVVNFQTSSEYITGNYSSNTLNIKLIPNSKLTNSDYILIELQNGDKILYTIGSQSISSTRTYQLQNPATLPRLFYKIIETYNQSFETTITNISTSYFKGDLIFDVPVSTEENRSVANNNLILTRYILPDSEENENLYEYNSYIKIGNKVYYNGIYNLQPNEEGIRLYSGDLKINDFLKLFYKNVVKDLISAKSNNGLIIQGNPQIQASTHLTINKITIDQQNLIQNSSIAIVQTFPSIDDQSKFEISINPDDNDIYNLKLIHKSFERTYHISFLPDKVDGYGVNLYYERINNLQTIFKIVKLSDINLPNTRFRSNYFGSQIQLPELDPIDYYEAVRKATNIDNFYFDIIFDSGISHPLLTKLLGELAKELHSIVPIGIPETVKTKEEIINYINATSVDSYRVHFSYPPQIDSSLGILKSNSYYIERLSILKSNPPLEYAPVSWKTYGIISANSPIVPTFSKGDREELLRYRVNFIIKNDNLGISYFNNNLTAQKIESHLSFENNVRLVNTISQLAETYLDSILVEYNTFKTRAQIVSALTKLIDSRVAQNKKFTIQHPDNPTLFGIKVICDETNNPPEVIDAGELVVELEAIYGRPITRVKIFNKVKKLGQ